MKSFFNFLSHLSAASSTYIEKLSDPIVQATVNENKWKFEPFGDLVDAALSDFRAYLTHNPYFLAQQKNYEVEDMLPLQDEEPNEVPFCLDKLNIQEIQ